LPPLVLNIALFARDQRPQEHLRESPLNYGPRRAW
jgi:hypothetical protein